MKKETHKQSQSNDHSHDMIAQLKTQLGYIVAPDFSTDCYIRVDGRLTGKLVDLAKKLKALLERDYPEPKQPSHCLCCGQEVRQRHE